jgi:addiction module toxin, RelE/StbE family
MEKYNVQITNPAADDIRKLYRYISENFSAPDTALSMVKLIHSEINKLRQSALVYPLVRNERLAAKGYRMIVVKKYLIFYAVKNKSVFVRRILHSRQNWMNTL